MGTESRQWFRSLFVINFAVTLGFGISDAFFSLYSQGLGARGLTLGATIGFYSLTKILCSPLMGSLSDRLGRKQVIVASLSLFLLVSAGYLFISDLSLLILLRILQGVSCSMFRPVVSALVGERAAVSKRAETVATFDLSFYGALSTGPLVGGVIMDIWGFNGVFAVLNLLLLFAVLTAVATLPQEKQIRPRTVDLTVSRTLSMVKRPFQCRILGSLMVYILGRSVGIVTFISFVPILLSTEFGLSGFQIGMIMTSGTLTMAASLKLSGRLADCFSRFWLIVVGGVMVSFCYLLVPLVTTFNQMLLLSMAIGSFSALSQPACKSMLIDAGEKFGIGFVFGTFDMGLNLGLSVGSFVGALLFTVFGTDLVFCAGGFCGLLAVILFAKFAPAVRSTGEPADLLLVKAK